VIFGSLSCTELVRAQRVPQKSTVFERVGK
jgi:hypothetical protein